MTEVKDLSDQILRFSTVEYVASASQFVFSLVGAVANGLIFALLIKQRSQKSSGHIIYESLFLAGLLYSFQATFFNAFDMSAGGVARGKLGCAISGYLSATTSCLAAQTLTLLSIERYIAVVQAMRPDKLKLNYPLLIAAIWISSAIPMMPFFLGTSGQSFGLQPGHIKCSYAWWNFEPISVVLSIYTLLSGVGGAMTIFFAYYHIVTTYFQVVKEDKLVKDSMFTSKAMASVLDSRAVASTLDSKFNDPKANLAASQAVPERISAKEREVLIKAIAVTGTFVVCWAPYM